MSLIEGLVAGLPALGMISPGVADTVEDGVNGLLTDYDLDAFSRGFRRLLTDGDLRARLAAGARRTSDRYDIERTTGQIVALYQELLQSRTGTEKEAR